MILQNCTRCHGRGKVDGIDCFVCLGKGRIEISLQELEQYFLEHKEKVEARTVHK